MVKIMRKERKSGQSRLKRLNTGMIVNNKRKCSSTGSWNGLIIPDDLYSPMSGSTGGGGENSPFLSDWSGASLILINSEEGEKQCKDEALKEDGDKVLEQTKGLYMSLIECMDTISDGFGSLQFHYDKDRNNEGHLEDNSLMKINEIRKMVKGNMNYDSIIMLRVVAESLAEVMHVIKSKRLKEDVMKSDLGLQLRRITEALRVYARVIMKEVKLSDELLLNKSRDGLRVTRLLKEISY